VGALGCAALLGLGNGAVFKLVPQYFPGQTGTVTGLVGAMGGLGGFFPPLLLAFFRESLGVIWPGFVLLAATALALWWGNQRVFVARRQVVELQLPVEARRRAAASRGLGNTLHSHSGCSDRGRLAQFARLRCSPGHVYVRGDIRHLGRRIPLQRLVAETAHAPVLGARMGTFPQRGAHQERAPATAHVPDAPGGPDVYPQALASALVDASIYILGLRVGDGSHVSPGFWLDWIPQSSGQPDDLHDIPVRVSGRRFCAWELDLGTAVSCLRYIGSPGARGRGTLAVAPDAGPGSAERASPSRWICFRSFSCSPFPLLAWH
jgi:hypothetical protein